MKQNRILILPLGAALLLASVLAGPALRAQGHGEAAAAAPTHAGEAHPASAAHGETAAPEASHEGAAHEGAAHEGAAHEGAGHEGAHHATVTLFGHDLGALAQFGVKLFNFVLFAGLLVFLLKGALASAFKARTQELEDKLSQAERDKAEAAVQIQELDARMAGLQQELEGIMGKAETEANREKERILESARQEAAQILAQTQAEIAFQQRQAEEELRALVTNLAVAGAAQRLEARLAGAAGAQALDQAIQQVGGAK